MTPDYLLDLQDDVFNIQQIKERILNDFHYKDEAEQFKSENTFICFVQHFFLVEAIKKLSLNELHQLLRECSQRNPEAQPLIPRIEACKNFLDSENYQEFRLMNWLLGKQPVFTQQEEEHFNDVLNLRNALFLNRPFRQVNVYILAHE